MRRWTTQCVVLRRIAVSPGSGWEAAFEGGFDREADPDVGVAATVEQGGQARLRADGRQPAHRVVADARVMVGEGALEQVACVGVRGVGEDARRGAPDRA